VNTFSALLMAPEFNIRDEGRTLLSCIETDYVRAFAPRLMDMFWRFTDTNAWIVPVEGLLPEQIDALRGVGAKEVQAEKRAFFTTEQAELDAYRRDRDRHFFCVSNAIDDGDFSIEVYIVRRQQTKGNES
jgi:hypothetical protein